MQLISDEAKGIWLHPVSNPIQTTQRFLEEHQIIKSKQKQGITIHNPQHYKTLFGKKKSEVFKSIWREIFKISPEEKASFGQQNEIIVNNFIHENKNIIEPHHYANIDKLDASDPLTAKIKAPRKY